MEIEHNASRAKWWILVAIGTSTFMTALDTSVVNTVLPVIRTDFHSDVAGVQWVVIIYLLVVSGLLLSFGRLGDLRGHKSIFQLGFGIFILSSALCGLAPATGALIAFRGVQALGAAMLAANSPAILTTNFPAEQRGQALGLQATMTYLGLSVAPSLGGWLTDLLSWRAVFYINVPVGLLAFWLSWRFIPQDRPSGTAERFDLPGAALFLVGLVSLLFALNQGHEFGWTSPLILGLLAIAIGSLAAFIWLENHRPSPMLDLRLFSHRVFSASTASAVLNYIALFSVLFLLPFYLLQGRGLSPSQAGLILTAQPLAMAIVAPLSGTLSDRIGTQIPSVIGMAILTAGLIFLARLQPYSGYAQIALALGVVGLGTGIFISPNNSALMGAAPRNRQGIAAATLATARSVGMVLGIGISGAIFTTILAQGQGNDNLFRAIQVGFLVAGLFAALGIFTSAIKKRNG